MLVVQWHCKPISVCKLYCNLRPVAVLDACTWLRCRDCFAQLFLLCIMDVCDTCRAMCLCSAHVESKSNAGTSNHVLCAGSASGSQSAKVTKTVRASFPCQTRQQQEWAVTKHPLTLPPLRQTLNCLMTPLGNMMMLMRTCTNRGGISTPEVNSCSPDPSVKISMSYRLVRDSANTVYRHAQDRLDKVALHSLGP